MYLFMCCFFFSSRRRHTRWTGDWSSDVCSFRSRPQPRNSQGVQEFERHEGQRRERDDDGGGERWHGLEQEKIERRRVPERRKTAKEVVRGLHLPVGEIERARDDDDDARRHRQRLWQ